MLNDAISDVVDCLLKVGRTAIDVFCPKTSVTDEFEALRTYLNVEALGWILSRRLMNTSLYPQLVFKHLMNSSKKTSS